MFVLYKLIFSNKLGFMLETSLFLYISSPLTRELHVNLFFSLPYIHRSTEIVPKGEFQIPSLTFAALPLGWPVK